MKHRPYFIRRQCQTVQSISIFKHVAGSAAFGIALLVSAFASEAPESRHNLSSAQYTQLAIEFNNSGYRLQQVSGYDVDGSPRYAAIWTKGNGPTIATHHIMTGAEYQNLATQYDNQGFRLTWVDGYNVGNQTYFAAVWEQAAGPQMRAHHGMTSDNYQNKFVTYKAEGFRCLHVDGYRANNSDRYAALWVKDGGSFPRAHHAQSFASYQSTVNQNIADGYRPVHVSAWGTSNSQQYASLWQKGSGDPFWMRHHLNSQQYQAEAENFHFTGYHVKRAIGYTVNGTARFIAFWENPHMTNADLNLIEDRFRTYMADNNIPGVSIAIAKTGRLVYSRGFGFADLDQAELVSPTSRMRVASISKPITATAIMKLVDQNQLSLDDQVFGVGALLGTEYGTQPYSTRVTNIQVKHLLWHCSGFSNQSDDPMFNNHADHESVIDWMLDNRNPLADPEDQDEYLNFGYCVLGRIIEEVSGQSYEDYVVEHVLEPCGISAMEIGEQAANDRKFKESAYYYGNRPYTVIRPEHFDAHGGWIASATDLLRFKVRVDGSSAKKDIITKGSYTAMMQSSPAWSGRSMGWLFGNNGHGHNGCMDGTIGFLWDTDDGYTFAILANTRPEDDGCAWDARGMIEDILYDVSEWPNYDLFTGSHQALKPIIVNPDLGQLPGDLVFNSPTPVSEFPKYSLPTLPSRRGQVGRSSVVDTELTLKIPSPTPTPEPKITTKRMPLRGAQGLALSFPMAEGWDYLLERSTDGQRWSSQPVPTSTSRSAQLLLPAVQAVELFRVQVQSKEGTDGGDPTQPESVKIIGDLSFPR